MKTKEKILFTSMELFNRNGVQVITTNHISKAMNISPGNLYFHYDNKEAILRELFKRMASETYLIWRSRVVRKKTLLNFIHENFEQCWKYRFFHREMYALRRRDEELGKLWRLHMAKLQKLIIILYRHWVRQGAMVPLNDMNEMQYVSDTLLAMVTTFLQFFESANIEPAKASISRGEKHVSRLILPYTMGETRADLEHFIRHP